MSPVLPVCPLVIIVTILLGGLHNSNNIYSSQREIKAVVRSYTVTHNEKLNCIYLTIQTHKKVQKNAIDFIRTKTQSANCWGNPLYQSTKDT